ncbi:MAG: transketolase [Thermotogae bacterium]|nr:transketolase [Thermotogota bacterium]
MDSKELLDLKLKAVRVRKDIVEMTYRAQSGHQGGALSWVEIGLILFFKIMNLKKEDPLWEDRDRFILSKGHACATLYSIWSLLGWIDREELWKFRRVDGILQGHPSRRRTPIAETSTGSLSQGTSVALGMALGLKMWGRSSRVYALISDAELQEGQTWEAVETAGNRRISNLTFVLDFNGLQIEGDVREINDPTPIKDKFEAFKWKVREVEDGHNFSQLYEALEWATEVEDAPQLVVAKTIKGKGVSFMEGRYEWHSKVLNEELYRKAIEELDRAEVELKDVL